MRHSSSHSWSHAQGLMNPNEVVMHVENSQRCNVVLRLLAEGIRQASESAHTHPHREILTLDVTCTDVLRVRRSLLGVLLAGYALTRRVARVIVHRRAIDLLNDAVVDVIPE